MFKKLYPNCHVKSVYKIDYDKLFSLGYRGIIFDLDNTLVHHGDNSNKKVDNLFKQIKKKGFKTCILTNNTEERVKRFLKNIDSYYIFDADKPKKDNYIKACEIMKLSKNKVIYVGDQIFVDILGANRAEVESILVDFIRKNNSAKIGKKRILEKYILKFYKKSKKYNSLDVCLKGS